MRPSVPSTYPVNDRATPIASVIYAIVLAVVLLGIRPILIRAVISRVASVYVAMFEIAPPTAPAQGRAP